MGWCSAYHLWCACAYSRTLGQDSGLRCNRLWRMDSLEAREIIMEGVRCTDGSRNNGNDTSSSLLILTPSNL